MSKLEIQTGEPPEPGRYVVWTPCKALQAREWCEPSIATWQGGRWHTFDPPWAWIGPLPVVHGNDCLKRRTEELWPEGEPQLTPAEENELVDRINGTPNLQPEYDL